MNAYIIDAVRTPRGRGNDRGALKGLAPAELLAQSLRALARRTGVDTAMVEDGIFGCVTQTAGQGSNIGKLGLIAAGWSDAVSGLTINRYCASGLSAVSLAALQAQASDALAVGGGVEMMSRVPMASDLGPLTHDVAFQKENRLVPIGIAADVVATQRGYSRLRCDEFAAQSQARAVAARAAGRFVSVVPVTDAAGTVLLAADETPREGTTAEKLSAMAPAFAEWGAKGIDAMLAAQYGLAGVLHVHHAGNSPAMADGASAVLVGSESAVRRAGLVPRARILASAEAGVDRTLALTGSVDAARRAIARAGLAVGDIDRFEVNESFAALMLHFRDEMGIGEDRLNVNGGAIALGHAMGATGAVLLGMLLDELELRDARYGCVAICGAAGVASAMVIERLVGRAP
ncbi:MAG: acetyl-CoA C-acyltransferase [Burkholderiales bacterium]|nr:acetyl-CoA C-acyltransferase [Burkholderiales bacterium]